MPPRRPLESIGVCGPAGPRLSDYRDGPARDHDGRGTFTGLQCHCMGRAPPVPGGTLHRVSPEPAAPAGRARWGHVTFRCQWDRDSDYSPGRSSHSPLVVASSTPSGHGPASPRGISTSPSWDGSHPPLDPPGHWQAGAGLSSGSRSGSNRSRGLGAPGAGWADQAERWDARSLSRIGSERCSRRRALCRPGENGLNRNIDRFLESGVAPAGLESVWPWAGMASPAPRGAQAAVASAASTKSTMPGLVGRWPPSV